MLVWPLNLSVILRSELKAVGLLFDRPLVTHLSALHSLVKVQRVLSLIGQSHVSIIPVAFTARFTHSCARTEDEGLK